MAAVAVAGSVGVFVLLAATQVPGCWGAVAAIAGMWATPLFYVFVLLVAALVQVCRWGAHTHTHAHTHT